MLHDIELNCSEIAETIEGRATTVNAEPMSASGQKLPPRLTAAVAALPS
jgi:hypothetical protein